jgi:hypothetical protein
MSNNGLSVGVIALAFFDLGGAACYRPALFFWCRSGVAPGLPQEWFCDSEWGLGRKGQWETKVLKVPG